MTRSAEKWFLSLWCLISISCLMSLVAFVALQSSVEATPQNSDKPGSSTNLILVELKDASVSHKRGQNLTARFESIDQRKRKLFDICFPSHSFTPKEREIMDLIEKSVSWTSPSDVHELHIAKEHPKFQIPENVSGYTTDFSEWIIVTKPINGESKNRSKSKSRSESIRTKGVTPSSNQNRETVKQQIEILRKQIPEAKTISEQNGVSIKSADGESYTLTRLAAASETVRCDSPEDFRTLMQYLEDKDLKIRFIAASILERKLKAHPNGMSMSEIDGDRPELHRKLLERFQSKIDRLSKKSNE